MNNLGKLGAVAAGLMVGAMTANATLAIYNTGQNVSGVIDNAWKVSGPGVPVQNATLVTTSFPLNPWVDDTPTTEFPTINSAWISYSSNGGALVDNEGGLRYGNAPVGVFTFTFTFDLTGYNHDDAMLSGRWASDNGSVVMLNGIPIGNKPEGNAWAQLSPLGTQSHFQAGLNTLSVTVTNIAGNDTQKSANPMGLIVDDLKLTSSSGNMLVAVPETSTVLAGLMMVLPFSFMGFRMLRRKQS